MFLFVMAEENGTEKKKKMTFEELEVAANTVSLSIFVYFCLTGED